MAEIAAHHEVRPTQVTAWKTQLLENATAIFGGEAVAADERERIRELHELAGACMDAVGLQYCLEYSHVAADSLGATGSLWTYLRDSLFERGLLT